MAASVDLAAAAVIYAATTAYSWGKALAVPGLQALASIKLLKKQYGFYKNIRRDQRRLLDESLENYVTSLRNILPDLGDAYPNVPRAANYRPVDPCLEQRRQIECNLGGMNKADEWANCINRLNNQSDIARAVFFDPRWVANVDLYAMSVGDLLRGRFPVNSRTSLLANSSEKSAFETRNGATGFRPARSFGLSHLRMAEEGRDELVGEAQMMEGISPHNRQMDIRDMMQTPQQRISLALAQAQLVQNSFQNLFNRNAQAPPYKMAQISVRLERAINRLQQEASKATLSNTFVPNYTAILQPMIAEVSRGLTASMNFTPTTEKPVEAYPEPISYEPRVRPTK